MARKATTKTTKSQPSVSVGSVSTPVRNSAIPKSPLPAAKQSATREQIAQRAYQIHLTGQGGSELENWLQSERELNSI